MLTGGRVLASFGVGWSELEFAALSSDFHTRGARLDEIVQIIRTAWSQDYVPIETAHYSLPPVKIAPKPAHPIPLWISGTSEPAYRRATAIGDGYHGHSVQDILIDNVDAKVARIRRDRPEESFTFSVYTWEWDLARRSEDEILAEKQAYEDAGVAARGHLPRHRRPRHAPHQHPPPGRDPRDPCPLTLCAPPAHRLTMVTVSVTSTHRSEAGRATG